MQEQQTKYLSFSGHLQLPVDVETKVAALLLRIAPSVRNIITKGLVETSLRWEKEAIRMAQAAHSSDFASSQFRIFLTQNPQFNAKGLYSAQTIAELAARRAHDTLCHFGHDFGRVIALVVRARKDRFPSEPWSVEMQGNAIVTESHVEATLILRFGALSWITLSQGIVWKTSIKGHGFLQFPTIFKDVFDNKTRMEPLDARLSLDYVVAVFGRGLTEKEWLLGRISQTISEEGEDCLPKSKRLEIVSAAKAVLARDLALIQKECKREANRKKDPRLPNPSYLLHLIDMTGRAEAVMEQKSLSGHGCEELKLSLDAITEAASVVSDSFVLLRDFALSCDPSIFEVTIPKPLQGWMNPEDFESVVLADLREIAIHTFTYKLSLSLIQSLLSWPEKSAAARSQSDFERLAVLSGKALYLLARISQSVQAAETEILGRVDLFSRTLDMKKRQRLDVLSSAAMECFHSITDGTSGRVELSGKLVHCIVEGHSFDESVPFELRLLHAAGTGFLAGGRELICKVADFLCHESTTTRS